MTPTQAALKHYRDKGYHAAVVEKWIPTKGGAGFRQDLFGFADIFAFNPDSGISVLIQACTRGDLNQHLIKIMQVAAEFPILGDWLKNPGHQVVICALAKRKERGKKRIRYEVVEQQITF